MQKVDGSILIFTFFRDAFDPVGGPGNLGVGKLGYGDGGKFECWVNFFDGMGLPGRTKIHGNFTGGEGVSGRWQGSIPNLILTIENSIKS